MVVLDTLAVGSDQSHYLDSSDSLGHLIFLHALRLNDYLSCRMGEDQCHPAVYVPGDDPEPHHRD